MAKYLIFQETSFKGKTKRFNIMSKSSGLSLGRISWYSQWRQYTFNPGYETIWNKDCLKEIQDFLQELMDERKYCQCEQPLVAEVDKPTFHRCYKCMKLTTEKQQEYFRK